MLDPIGPNLPTLFFEQAAKRGTRPFLWARRDDSWIPLSWAEAAERVVALSRGLRSHGIGAGDRVALVSENRPEWLIADLAILSTGAAAVPAYTTNTVDDHRHVLSNSGARAAIVSTAALLERVQEAARSSPTVEFLVHIDRLGAASGASGGGPAPARAILAPPALPLIAWDDLLATSAGSSEEILRNAHGLKRTDLACIMHTSGTGGRPKGVMLSHGAILSNLEGALLHFRDLGLTEEVFLSVLPASHAYEHTAGQFFPISLGGQIYYVENAARFGAALPEVRPTLVAAVPRLCELAKERILREAEKSRLRSALLRAAVDLGRRRFDPARPLSPFERALDRVLDPLVRRRIRAGFGGRMKAIISGGAPLHPETSVFFNALGVRLLQGYGQTETAPVVSCNPPEHPKPHTVGIPFHGVEVKLGVDDEILVRGELVMRGYWNDPGATRAVFADGWLCTGDVGRIDPDGHLVITDRKRDIIKTSGGDRVSPLKVEEALLREPEIGQAVVFGEGRPQLAAILVPSAGLLDEAANSGSTARQAEDPAIRSRLAAAVARANSRLAPPERVRSFLVAREPFSTQNSLLTPTLKARRYLIQEAYRTELESMYNGARDGVS